MFFVFRELKSELKELEEKFRKAMVANASLDNEKCQLMFQVHPLSLNLKVKLNKVWRWIQWRKKQVRIQNPEKRTGWIRTRKIRGFSDLAYTSVTSVETVKSVEV